jgi:quinoprotein glucose dehydrogenase
MSAFNNWWVEGTMKLKVSKTTTYEMTKCLLILLTLVAGFVSGEMVLLGQSGGNNKEVDWTSWGGGPANLRYRPFDQINASNFSKLEVAWRFKTDNLGPRPEYKLEGTPLMIHGAIYATGGTRRSVVALDAATGELKWVHSELEGPRGANAPRLLSGRGLSFWTDGREERIFYVTPGYRLVGLDAKTGQRIHSFGNDGIVDLRLNDDQDIDLGPGADIGLNATALVAKDVVIVGAAHLASSVPRSKTNIKGYVRGFDARTGKRLWIFHTVPKQGEVGYDTWGLMNPLASPGIVDGVSSAQYTGNTGMWAEAAADEELGLAYLPIESATGDTYGGPRPGANLFSDSLVAVDIKTGARKWHYQTVHHDIWDLDIPCAPILANITVDGKPIKAVIVAGKQGYLYVLDRVTGKPVWPIPETPVPAGDVPGEWYSPTQPIPSKPPSMGPNYTAAENLIDFTPELREEALSVVRKYKMGPTFNPPVLSKADGYLGSFSPAGIVSWGGGAFDPETQVAYYENANRMTPKGVVAIASPDISDIAFVGGRAGQRVSPQPRVFVTSGNDIARFGGAGAPSGPPPTARTAPVTGGGAEAGGGEGGGGGGGTTVRGLTLFKPPYGTMSAFDMKNGTLAWQVPHGETPDNVRNNPALKGITIPKTGQFSDPNMPTLVTKTLVICGEPQFTTTPTHPRGALLRAYDKATGQDAGAVYMPAPENGAPMTYMLDDVQYIVLAIGGGNYSAEYVAFRLPREQVK